MSTEPQNDLQTNALAARLSRGWEQFKKGELVSFRVLALLLLVVAGVGLWLYIRAEKAVAASQAWVQLDGASTDSALREVAATHKGTLAGRVAELHLARNLLGPEGIDKLLERESAERTRAVKNVEEARELLARLAGEFGDQPVMKAECYLGLTKAETALIGVPKEGKLDEFRGSVDGLLGHLDKLAEAAEGSAWGDDARAFAARLRAAGDKQKVRDELLAVQRNLYGSSLAAPALPGGGPLAPGSPFGGIGSLPGGGPLSPPVSPPTTPSPTVGPNPSPTVTPPVGPAPVPPSVSPLTPGGQPSNPAQPEPPKK